MSREIRRRHIPPGYLVCRPTLARPRDNLEIGRPIIPNLLDGRLKQNRRSLDRGAGSNRLGRTRDVHVALRKVGDCLEVGRGVGATADGNEATGSLNPESEQGLLSAKQPEDDAFERGEGELFTR